MGQRAEKIKLFEIATEQHFKFLGGLGVLLLIVMAVWYFWSARNSANMVGATNAEVKGAVEELRGVIGDLRTVVKTVNTKIDAIDTSKMNNRLDDLGDTQRELTKAVSAVTIQANRLGANLTSVRDVTDQARDFIAHTDVSINGTDGTLPRLNALIKTSEVQITKLTNDGSLLIETINDEAQDLLDKLSTLTVSADGTIRAYQPVGVNLTGITANLDRMTKDSADKWHSILYPEPVKGFWPRTKQVFGYLYRPAFDGIRLYYTLQSLPVRITNPIPK